MSTEQLDPLFQASVSMITLERSSWQCHCAGITYIPPKGAEPNAFHRFMQRLAFGFRWERRP